MKDKLEFSFWNYLPFGTLDNTLAAKKWADIGSTLAMSFVYDSSKDNKNDMLDLLDECDKYNIKLLIVDDRTSFLRLDTISKDEFVEGVKQAYIDFGKHKATWGFYIGDEPDFDHIEQYIFALRTVKEVMPNLHNFGNLLPYFNGLNDTIEVKGEQLNLIDLTKRIIKEGKADILSYDHYTQLNDDLSSREDGLIRYFNDLEHFSKIAKEENIPLYCSLISVGHWYYAAPNEDDIRWQISTSLAYGCKGIMWFYFHQQLKDLSYIHPPFLGEEAIETPTYGMIKRQQYFVNKLYKPVLDELEFIKVQHLNSISKYVDHFTSDENILLIKPDRDLPLLISTFRNINTKKVVLMITNASQKYANMVDITIKGGIKKTLRLASGELCFVNID